jgi:hypothetical protein
LLTGSGAIVTAHQQNHDATRPWSGAAVAYGTNRTYHIPDLEAVWPERPQSRCFLEAKAKSPLQLGGGWGWDKLAFKRAWRWAQMNGGAPVFYAIRDISRVPLPPACGDEDFRDDPDLWSIASVLKLGLSPVRTADDAFYFWPRSDFLPLQHLLDGAFAVQSVPYIASRVGDVRTPCLL